MEINRSKYSRKKRKKLHVGEYRQFGFTVLIKMRECGYEKQEDIEFIDKMYDDIIDIIESEKLHCAGGGGKDSLSFAITDQGRKNTVTEDKAKRVLERIKAVDSVIDAEVFPVVDCWNFTDEMSAKEDVLIKEAKVRLGIKD